MVAEILPSGATEATGAVRPAEPGDADTLADREPRRTFTHPTYQTHDLMTEHERQLGVGQLAVDDVEIGSTDRARLHIQADLSGSGLGSRKLGLAKKAAGTAEDHRAHLPLRTLDDAWLVRQPRSASRFAAGWDPLVGRTNRGQVGGGYFREAR